MRIFQSVSGHRSEQSTAQFSWRPAVSQLKGVSDTISNWFENHRPQRTQISTVTNVPFCTKLESNQVASRLTAIASFPSVFFQLLQYSKLFGTLGCSDDKNWLTFPPFSSRFLDFAAQFCFRCKFSFHEIDSGVIFLNQSQFFATYSNQWDCFILYR